MGHRDATIQSLSARPIRRAPLAEPRRSVRRAPDLGRVRRRHAAPRKCRLYAESHNRPVDFAMPANANCAAGRSLRSSTLDRWARHRSVGTEHATVPRFGPQNSAASSTHAIRQASTGIRSIFDVPQCGHFRMESSKAPAPRGFCEGPAGQQSVIAASTSDKQPHRRC